MDSTLQNIGSTIKKYRTEAGLSQEELSTMCGVERAQLSRIESGEVLGVTYATMEKILNALNKTLIPSSMQEEHLKNMHPFVKWAGGKTQLLEKIKALMPKQFKRYYEPFVGGGALLFSIEPLDFVINDMNEELIMAYQCFLNEDSFTKLKELLDEHESKHSEEYYYQIRGKDLDGSISNMSIEERAGRMIYLNKACFNGLYRVNSKGYFNVPSGKKKIVSCYDKDNFESIFMYFKSSKVNILNTDFENAVQTAQEGDFVYFDPPYDTLDNKDSFTSYNKNSFGKAEQKRLADVYKTLNEKGVYVMLSNHNTSYIRELYSDFKIHVVPAKRMINSKADGRGDVEEVLVTNYE